MCCLNCRCCVKVRRNNQGIACISQSRQWDRPLSRRQSIASLGVLDPSSCFGARLRSAPRTRATRNRGILHQIPQIPLNSSRTLLICYGLLFVDTTATMDCFSIPFIILDYVVSNDEIRIPNEAYKTDVLLIFDSISNYSMTTIPQLIPCVLCQFVPRLLVWSLDSRYGYDASKDHAIHDEILVLR